MSVVCWFVERAVAIGIARGDEQLSSWVLHHLESCRACRGHTDMLFGIHVGLADAMDVPEAPHNMISEACRRVDRARTCSRRASPVATLAMVSGLSAALLAVLGLVWWIGSARHHPLQTATEQQSPVGNQTDRPALAARPRDQDQRIAPQTANRYEGGTRQPRTGAAPRRNTEDVLHRLIQRARQKLAVAKPGHPETGKPQPATGERRDEDGSAPQPLQPEELARVGVYYETQADYRQAALAYSLASARSGDASISYAAGRAAEALGDYVSAVEHYRRVLSGTAHESGETENPSRS